MPKATERVALRPETKRLLDERKPEGVTYDHWIRTDPRMESDE